MIRASGTPGARGKLHAYDEYVAVNAGAPLFVAFDQWVSDNMDVAFANGATHFFGRVHGNPLGSFGNFQVGRSAHENHSSATTQGSFGDRVPHFSGGAVREESHGIERFARGTSGDENCFALQVAAEAENIENLLRDGFGGGEAASSRHAAGEISLIGINDVNASRA